ncbi:MAG TPA: PEGA domain-containing protein [Rectinemataceae bacterium]|nr:PEGA domain-containing protein [Rectinemataceae bacterium]
MKARRFLPFPLLVALFLASIPACAQIPDSSQGDVQIVTESTGQAGYAELEVHSSVAGSTVSINRVDAGFNSLSAGSVPAGGQYTAGVGATGLSYTIYQNPALAPGSYLIGVSAPGYYKREISVILDEKTKYYLYFSLVMISGSLDLRVVPPDATVLIDDHAVAAGMLTLPVGQHSVTARRFGYVERRVSVLISENETTSLQLELAPAPFAVSDLEVSRKAFNPANSGTFGRVEFRFQVQSFGSARLTLLDSAGSVVASRVFPSFDTWAQSYTWTGRDADGRPLPDGSYTATLVAQAGGASGGASGGEGGSGAVGSPAPASGATTSFSRVATVRIDSGLIVSPRGSLSAIPGLLLFPDPRGEAAGTSSAELTWLSPVSDMSQPSFALSASTALSSSVDLGFSAAAEDLASPAGGADLAAGIRYGLWGQSTTGGSAGAVFLRGSWSNAATPLLPDSAGSIELALPLAAALGPLQIGAAPALRLDLAGSQASLDLLARGGLWASGTRYRAGLSVQMSFASSAAGLAPEWPLQVGAELRFLLEPAPLVLSVLSSGAFSPDAAPAFVIGLGLGLLF